MYSIGGGKPSAGFLLSLDSTHAGKLNYGSHHVSMVQQLVSNARLCDNVARGCLFRTAFGTSYLGEDRMFSRRALSSSI